MEGVAPMSTYTDTLPTGDVFGDLFRPATYDLRLRIHAGQYVALADDADAADVITLLDIPSTITPAVARVRLSQIAMWPHPDAIHWSAIADARPGTLLHVIREDDRAYVSSRHWTGRSYIGAFRAA